MHDQNDHAHPPAAGVASAPSRNGSGDRAARDRVTALLVRGRQLGWDAPSRFRAPGKVARRVLHRLLKPYAIRQEAMADSLLAAMSEAATWLEELDGRTQALERTGHDYRRAEDMRGVSDAVILDGGNIMALDTLAGTLWYHKDDPLIAPAVQRHGMWEPDISSLLPKVLAPGMTFVDVGANIGYFPVMASPLVGRTGNVYAVEPEPRNVALLRANLWRNEVRNCVVLPVAAYHQSGHVTMALNDDMRAAWIVPNYDTTFLVPCARLDDLLGTRRVDVMKVDAEGSDHFVIRGAERLIAANPGILIVVEFLPREKDLHGETPAQVLEYYLSIGLKLYLLSSYGDLIPATPAEVLARGDEIDVINLALKTT